MIKKLLVINPNTSLKMSQDIQNTIEDIKDKDVEVSIKNPDFGTESLESFYEYSLASFGCLRMIRNLKKEYDGILIACFGDPGIYALKEICDCPVIGIAEASIAISILMGKKFSMLVASDKAVPMMESMVTQYGMNSGLASVESLGMNVLTIDKKREESIQKLTRVGKEAIEKGAEVLILGCAGMTGMKEEVERILGVPVIDSVECGYNTLEMIVKNNFFLSKIGLYMKPYAKEIVKSELLID